jgi:DNA-binding NtrC family response regulator
LDVTLEAAVGTDALGFACACHLAGSRKQAPLVIAEGTAAVAHSPVHWTGIDAPTSRAEGGTLVVLNVAALPIAAQEALAIALSARPFERGRPSFALIATVPVPPQGLLDGRHLSPALARFLLPHSVQLPRLVERAEDLRALVLDRLCHSGVRYAGEPLGIEPEAMGLLVNHPWPGNDAELRSVVDRAAHAAAGERVSVADLARIGFAGLQLERAVDIPTSPRARTERPSAEPVAGPRSERVVARRRRRR